MRKGYDARPLRNRGLRVCLRLAVGDDAQMTLRYYQEEAYAGAMHELSRHRSTMAVMATGLGKTRLFSSVAKHWSGRVLVLAHRSELVSNAAETLRTHCQEPVEIEQGNLRSERARLVVASVQSITQQRRLSRIGREGFSLVICDEVHRYLARTYRKVIDWFQNAKVLGVTATADRTDGKALGQIMESVCYRMDIKDGIRSGYLVPLKVGRVHIESIDLRGVNRVRGDLHEGKLEKVMLKSVGAVVHETMRLHPDRQGILFFPGVESAELAAQKMNTEKPGCAIFIDGKTDKDERAEKMAAFQAGKYQYLCNCLIAAEGFDAPRVSLVAIAAPTTSRQKYTQMVGRGGRVLAECVAGIDGEAQSEERRGAISWSDKPDCVVLDFVGNSGKHSLVSPLDLLGGDYTDEEQRAAKAEMELVGDEVSDPEELLARARKRLEARNRALREVQFMVNATVDYVDPFSCLGMNMEEANAMELKMGRMQMKPSTRATLENFGVAPEELDNMSQARGTKLLGTLFQRKRFGYCSYQQLQILKKWGLQTSRVFQRQAYEALGYLAECGFGKIQAVDAAKLRQLATGRA